MQKTNFKTRLLALLTAVFMVIMCVPFAAFADETVTKDMADKISVAFQGTDVNDYVYKKAATSGKSDKITAPEVDGVDYWQVDGGQLKVNPGESVAFTQLLDEIGTPLLEGTEYVGWVSFKGHPEEKNQKVEIVYYDFKNGATAGKETVAVAADKTTLTAEEVLAHMPAGYKLEVATTESFDIRNNACNVAVVPDTQDVEIVYYDFKNSTTAGKETVTVAADKTTLTAEEVLAHMPAGYKLEVATTESFDIRNNACNVAVVPDTQDVEIVYYDFKNDTTAGKKVVTVAANKTALTAEEIAAYMPDGYKLEVATTESFDIVNGYVNVAVVKKSVPATPVTPAKQIKANYFDEETNKQVAEVALKLYTDKNGNVKFVATEIEDNLPDGYKIVNCDYVERDGWVYVGIVKKTDVVTTAKANYYDETAEAQVAEKDVDTYTTADGVVKAVATDVSDKCPAGYEIVSSDYIVRDGYVYVSVKKAEVKKAKVNYFDEDAYKQIAEIEMETYTHGNDTKVKATEVYDKCPDGYEIVSSDYIVRDGYVYVSVKKAKNSSSSSSSASSSSSSSSSSNKTTTASSKAEQKVVKAAAAPANTTKVLPKTGASNVAPLLGGSLAVVALLMGYGVYSLVLRKKD